MPSTQTLRINNDFRSECCPICRSSEIKPIAALHYRTPTLFSSVAVDLLNSPELWECKECKSWFTQNIVRESVAINLYSTGSSDIKWKSVPFLEAKSKNIIAALHHHVKKGASVLDIGCNTGELLDYCKSLGAKTYGIELSASSRAVCEKKGHQMKNNLINVAEPMDVIFAFDVVEHLYRFADFVSAVQRALRPGGLFIILTGDNNSFTARWHSHAWWYLLAPEHIIFPSQLHFGRLVDFDLIDAFSTYASRGYKTKANQWPRALAMTLARRGSGLPLLRPDHQLLILQRRFK